MKLILDLNSALDSIARGRDLLREHWSHSLVFQDSSKFLEGLITHSCSKYLSYPSGWIAGLSIWKLLPFCNSWGKFKILLPPFLRYFDWYHMHLILQIYILFQRWVFFWILTLILSQSLIWRIVICNNLVENWDHIVFPSSSILFPIHNERSLLL